MDTCGIDERLREVYESNAPSVDEPAFSARLRRQSSRRQMLPAPRPRVHHPWLVAASCLLVAAALVVGAYEAVVHLGKERAIVVITDDSMKPSGTSSAAPSPGQAVLQQAVAWIEAAPTQVTFGPDTVTYGQSAKIAKLTRDPQAKGEFLIPWPTAWWSADTDYYYQDVDGPPFHVTPGMAMVMTKQTYPSATTGILNLVALRAFADPHRLLSVSKVSNATQESDGSWKVLAEATPRDLGGLDLSDVEPSQYLAPVTVFSTTLVIEKDGSIRTMFETLGGSSTDVLSYTWARANAAPELPGTSVDLDKAMLQDALKGGWRATVSDAAKDLSFPVYSLGDSYEGLGLRLIHVMEGSSLLLEYGLRHSPSTDSIGTTASAVSLIAAGGFVLFEYSESNLPDGEQSFVAKKTLLKTVSQGAETYSIYTTAKGKPGRSILVKRGSTYISIDRSGGGTGDATDELVAAAAALTDVSP